MEKQGRQIVAGIIRLSVSISLVLLLYYQASAVIQHYPSAKATGRIIRLNRLSPSIYFLVHFLQNPSAEHQSRLKETVRYLQTVIAYYPQMAEAYGILGYCYYHLGLVDEAIAAYREAATLNPAFFWHHYNLGVVHYREGRLQAAKSAWQAALGINPEATLQAIISSRLYMQILSTKGFTHAPDRELLQTYKKCRNWMVLDDGERSANQSEIFLRVF